MNSSITSLIQLKALLISLNGVFEMTVILPKSSRCVVGSFHALVAPELTSVYCRGRCSTTSGGGVVLN